MIDEPLIAIEVRAHDAFELRSFCETVSRERGRDPRPYATYFAEVVTRFGAAIDRAIKEGGPVRDGTECGPGPGGPPGA